MKFPDVNIPITPVRIPMEWIMRAERAVEEVRERLLKTCHTLEAAGIPYVVIGGNAVAVWVGSKDEGAIRNTKDVDVLLNRADLPRAAEAMAAAGFDLSMEAAATVFLDRVDPVPSRGVHVHFVGEPLRSNPTAIAPPINVGLIHDGIPVPELSQLVSLKLIAFRNIDRVHIRDMIRVGLIDDALAEQIPSALRPRLEEIRANPDG